MGHYLHAVVGPNAPVADFAGRWHFARLIKLPQDFALVPITAALFDDINELVNENRPSAFQTFERLSSSLEAIILQSTRHGPLGYIETECFGGTGEQKAIAWLAGELLIGPLSDSTEWTNAGKTRTPPGESAINRVLAAIGVWTKGGVDRFDVLGLGRYRDTERAAERTDRSGSGPERFRP